MKKIINAWGFENHMDPVVLDNYDNLVLSLEGFEPNIIKIIESARISCFSKREDNLMMWSHYADGLRGFCLEFDTKFILDNNDVELLEVLYQNNPSEIDTAEIAVLHDQVHYHENAIYEAEIKQKNILLKKLENNSLKEDLKIYNDSLDTVYKRSNVIHQKMLATKSIEWSYEEELRIILHSKNNNNLGVFMKYPKKSLKSIIIGQKMPVKQQQTIMKIIKAKRNKILIKKASVIDGRFHIKITDM
ncbi:DUF2971 domain-containing protein [Algibacter amylolyticus]|uniref:DUF2971 domain-containing protein n=1 Tax=Algibacter amylolyticus TaxID=1608400 RepID=UPI00155A79D2|nr:DUF2971 domain-containing protein [Algibacter amylolyticus]MBB5266970.1 hypothetical protein [Algibacter amylolyticus]